MVDYALISAVPENFVIGNKGKIPWYISEDFKLFKERTLDSVVIMGKTTWDSLPIRPLPKRVNIVLYFEPITIEGAIVCTSIPQALEKAQTFSKNIFVIGGASIYKQTIENAKWLYISHVKGSFEGDTFFPQFDVSKYKVLEEKKFEQFTFKKYERK